jgi:hypothetical protein
MSGAFGRSTSTCGTAQTPSRSGAAMVRPCPGSVNNKIQPGSHGAKERLTCGEVHPRSDGIRRNVPIVWIVTQIKNQRDHQPRK